MSNKFNTSFPKCQNSPIKLAKNLDTERSGKCDLDTIRNFCPLDGKPLQKSHYAKRRRAKAITVATTSKLGALDSPLNSGYKRAYHCANYLMQNGDKITSNYCKHRCCNVCNRIKSAKMLHGYAKPLMDIEDIHFVTLTAPNVVGEGLSIEMDRMQSTWRRIYKNIKQRYKELPVQGMYKLECTYNYRSKTYNPHFHLIISSKATAEEIRRQWLVQFPMAKIQAQDIRKADEGSLLELFKYVTKSVVGGNYSATAMDTIYQALQNRNTFYRVGIKKVVSEEIDDLESQTIDFGGETIDVWKWCNGGKDWYNSVGEAFIDQPISEKTSRLIQIVNKSKLPRKVVVSSAEIFKRHRLSGNKPVF